MKAQPLSFWDIFNKKQNNSENIYYSIPPYQRCYSWEKQHINIFLEDFFSEKLKKEWFLGSVIFLLSDSNKNNLKIIDGQQRIITITLILIVFLLLLDKNYKNPEDTKSIKNMKKTIEEILYYGNNDDKRLKMNFAKLNKDRHVYDDILECIKIPEKLKNLKKKFPKNKLLKSFEYIQKIIEEKENLNLTKIKSFFEEITKFAKFVVIEINNKKDNPLKIFETLNSTGKELSSLDLIKNYILNSYVFHDEIEQESKLEKYWENWEKIFNPPVKIENWNTINKRLEVFFEVLTRITGNWTKLNFNAFPQQKKIYISFKKSFPELDFNHQKEKRNPDEQLDVIEKMILIYYSFSEPWPSLTDLTKASAAFDWKEKNNSKLQRNILEYETIKIHTNKNSLKCFGYEIKILFLFFSILFETKNLTKEHFKKLVVITTISELLLRIFKDRIGQLSTTYNKIVNNELSSILEENENKNIVFLFNAKNKTIDEKKSTKIYENFLKFWKKRLEKDDNTCDFLKELKNINWENILVILKETLFKKNTRQKEILIKSILKFTTDKYEKIEYPTIEHLSPKSEESKEQNELGNLIFIKKELNQKAEDRPISEKIKFWSNSLKKQQKQQKNPDLQKLIFYVQDSNIKIWNDKEIKKRTEEVYIKFLKKIKDIFTDFNFF